MFTIQSTVRKLLTLHNYIQGKTKSALKQPKQDPPKDTSFNLSKQIIRATWRGPGPLLRRIYCRGLYISFVVTPWHNLELKAGKRLGEIFTWPISGIQRLFVELSSLLFFSSLALAPCTWVFQLNRFSTLVTASLVVNWLSRHIRFLVFVTSSATKVRKPSTFGASHEHATHNTAPSDAFLRQGMAPTAGVLNRHNAILQRQTQTVNDSYQDSNCSRGKLSHTSKARCSAKQLRHFF